MCETAIIGYGKMPADCAQILARGNEAPRSVIETRVSAFSSLEGTCARLGVPFERLTAAPQITDRLVAMTRPMVVFSINNDYLFPRAVLEKSCLRVINFHGSLLPYYRGHGDVIPSWIIFNGERTHGVTWHLVAERPDCGDIVCQATVNVTESDTALTLMMRVVQAGTRLFEEHWREFLSPTLTATSQRDPVGHALRRTDLPGNGWLDLNWDFPTADRFLRSMDSGPLHYLPLPKLAAAGRSFQIVSYRAEVRHNGKPGLSLAPSSQAWRQRARLGYPDGSIELELVESRPGHPC